MIILAVILGVSGAVFLFWWLFLETEGVYLGRRVVIWLYDLYANRYDRVKAFNHIHEHILLAQPILKRIEPHTNPLVLDVATGTGRLPIALLNHARFDGTIIGVDLSAKMLTIAEEKFRVMEAEDQATLLHYPAEALPFGDNSFDLVTCLESLEFMTGPQSALAEMIRVLRPGGLLLITNRIGARWLPGKTWKQPDLESLLRDYGMEQIEFEDWQEDYQKVWSVKRGCSEFIGASAYHKTLFQIQQTTH